MRTRRRIILKVVGIVFLICFIGAVAGVAFVAQLIKDLPSPGQFVDKQITQSTKIYDRTGEVLLYEIYGDEKRTVIPFEDIPEYAKQATIVIEDQNFYTNPAFDWRGIVRSVYVNIARGRLEQGGSTITQQLARNAFLTPEKTLTRKIKELILAHWIEQNYSKDEILNLYLNQIPYGSNAYGIEAASHLYFGKSVKDATLAESAALAAILNRPSYYSPWGKHREELESRRKHVLDQMESLGYIDKEEYLRAQQETIVYANQTLGAIKAPHFVMMVREYLYETFGEEAMRTEGFKVLTTLDWDLQQAGEAAVKEGSIRNAKQYKGENAALVAQDSNTGQVLALVGSRDYFATSSPAGCVSGSTCQLEGNFNVAAHGLRQPGSSFKPFAYITAFQKGYLPESIVFDVPTEFSTDREHCPILRIDYTAPREPDDPCFHPENFDRQFRGPVTLRDGLAQSMNVPSVKVLYLADLYDTISNAELFGVSTLKERDRYGLSLVLGGGEVTLLDMVGAYSVFAEDGVKHAQSFILEVRDSRGTILEKFTDSATQVIESQYTRLLNDVLSDTEVRGKLFGGSLGLTLFPDREVALKTGTTNEARDAWTIGYTPSLVVGVWAGNNNNKPMVRGSSITAAVPIWSAFMQKALQSQPIEVFPQPDPPAPVKPILAGTYIINNQIHDTLFYVNKKDPLGPDPLTPDDSQFYNWELPLYAWVGSQNLSTLGVVMPPPPVPPFPL